MKTIGLIGGISWHSTQEYYREINTLTAQRIGATRSAPIHMVSLDFHEVLERKRNKDDEGVFGIFLDAARTLARSGVDFLALCSNTSHQYASRLEVEVGLPLVHIADATADEIKRHGFEVVGLLGTSRTMEDSFLKDRLSERHGLHVLTPSAADRCEIDRYIFDEMVRGTFSDDARRQVGRMCLELSNAGAQAIILGCTELPVLMRNFKSDVPLLDSTSLHAKAIVDSALT